MKAIDTRTALGAASFTVAPALLASITPPTLALACLPLLVSLFAVRRGHSWGAFALLGGATCLATMAITEVLAWPSALASAGALLTCGVVMPHLWRFDKAATAIVMTITMALGTIAGVFVEKVQSSPCSASIEVPIRAPIEAPTKTSIPSLEPSPDLAELVGVYRSSRADGEKVLILNTVGGASLELEDGEMLKGSFGKGTNGGIDIRLNNQTMRFTLVSGDLVGPQGQGFQLMGAKL